MRAHVTNRSRSARGVELDDGSIRFVEPGQTSLLDLAPNPLHEAWAASGDLAIVAEPPPPPPDKAARRGRPSRNATAASED